MQMSSQRSCNYRIRENYPPNGKARSIVHNAKVKLNSPDEPNIYILGQ